MSGSTSRSMLSTFSKTAQRGLDTSRTSTQAWNVVTLATLPLEQVSRWIYARAACVKIYILYKLYKETRLWPCIPKIVKYAWPAKSRQGHHLQLWAWQLHFSHNPCSNCCRTCSWNRPQTHLAWSASCKLLHESDTSAFYHCGDKARPDWHVFS